jgi:large subunit ribosomal protein L25
MQILDLKVEQREKLGSANSRRYCRDGKIPMVLYGRGQDNVTLLCEANDFGVVTKAHTAIVRLTVGDIAQTALIRDVAWDTFGDYVQHIDLVRVEADDQVDIKVPIHYHGVPAGAAHGGALHVILPELLLHCRVDSIPSELHIDVSHLEVDQGVKVGEIEYPENVRPSRPDSDLLAHCKEPKVAVEHTEEGEEGEEGAAPAEGDAPAAGDAPADES